MRISDSNPAQVTPADWRQSLDYAVETVGFQRHLSTAQSGAAGTSAETDETAKSDPAREESETLESKTGRPALSTTPSVRDAHYMLDGVEVGFDALPPETQRWFRDSELKRAECEAYRARVADDPAVGAYAKMRPYDEALDGWAMTRLAAMDPRTAHMSPKEYYNYAGSDAEKYDNITFKSQAPASNPANQVFAVDPVEESKVQLVRDLRAQGKALPNSYAQFEKLWLSATEHGSR